MAGPQLVAAQPATTPTAQSAPAPRFSRSAEREIRFQEGLLYYQRKRLDLAEQAFREVLEGDPADAEAHYYLGLTLLDRNRAQEAVQSFDQSIRLDPTSDEVRAARAAANIRLNHLDAAEEDLSVLEPDPRWAGLVSYLRGQLLFRRGDYRGAAKAYREAQEIGGPEAEAARFQEGYTYLVMRELVRARSAFRETSISPEQDPTVAAAARQLDAVLARQQRADRPWELQITTGIEYDSNAIFLGSDVTPPEGISDEEDIRFLLQPRGSYSWKPSKQSKLEYGVEGSGYFTWYTDVHDFDLESYQAGPFASYRLSKNVFASARYAFNYLYFGHEPSLSRHIVTPQVTVVEKDFGYTSAYLQYQHREYYPFTAPARDLDGDIYSFGIVQGIEMPALFADAGPTNLELNYRFDRQATEGDDYDGNLNSFGLTYYAPLPVWKLRADVGVSVDLDRFSEPNSRDEDGDRRRDVELGFVAGLTKRVNDNLSVRVDYSFTDQDSNVKDIVGGVEQQPFDYDRHVVGVRLIMSF